MYLNLYNYLIFIPMIYISSSFIFISSSWLSNWMIMEINLISFMSLLIFEKKYNSEIPINFFLIQSLNSYIFIMSSMNLNFLNNEFMNLFMLLMSLSMLTKMGMPPFYLWYLKVMKNLNWMNLFFLTTIQKIIPMIILNNIINISNLMLMNLLIFIILTFSMTSALLGIQYFNLKLIMAYSSIIQLSWMILLMFINENLFISYFILYKFINFSMSQIFKKFNFINLINLNLLKFNSKNIYFMLMMMMFCLASIPPSMGFLMKWISIQSTFKMMNFMIILIMIFNSLISMYFYIRIMFISMMNFSNSVKINQLKINYPSTFNYSMISLNWFLITMLLLYEIF